MKTAFKKLLLLLLLFLLLLLLLFCWLENGNLKVNINLLPTTLGYLVAFVLFEKIWLLGVPKCFWGSLLLSHISQCSASFISGSGTYQFTPPSQ